MAWSPPSLRCPAGHSFDRARQGYVHLSASPIRHPGDSSAMVQARQRVQDAGLLDGLTDALVAAVPAGEGVVVDAGGGTGHHLAAVLRARPAGCGVVLDTAKPALRRAARAHDRLLAVTADSTMRWPLRDACADAVLLVFAPRNPAEVSRVLAPSGVAVVATPLPAHLAELVGPMGMLGIDPDKAERLADRMGEGFLLADDLVVEQTIAVSRAQAVDLAVMGPVGFHTEVSVLEQRAAALPPVQPVTVAVRVSRWVRG